MQAIPQRFGVETFMINWQYKTWQGMRYIMDLLVNYNSSFISIL
uniref:Uncharacterized protein n=1 Tax=Rhizophora mucronata TaxID=61149 RepID=A0A2P2N207_RHIMU